MDVTKVNEFLALTISKDVLKSAVGDGAEFELIYETVLNSSLENMSLSDDEKSTDENLYSYIGSTSTQSLEDIPLVLRSTQIQTGEIYLQGVSEANNNISSSSNYELNLSENESYDMDEIYNAVDKYSAQYGVDKDLILAIIKQESNFNPNAVSSAGAKGLMQLMDFNSEAYGVNNPFDIDENINAGVKHIKSYLDLYDGNVEMALMAYNAGPGTVERRGVNSVSDLYKMPEETQNYVTKIMGQLA